MSEYRRMACEEVEERLSDWLEHDVDATTRTMLERHVADCARCTALVADLKSIRAQAASLPGLVPSRDLWPEIEARIQAQEEELVFYRGIVSPEEGGADLRVDLRLGEETSGPTLIKGGRVLDDSGRTAFLVTDEHDGKTACLVVLDDGDGRVLAHRTVTIGMD